MRRTVDVNDPQVRRIQAAIGTLQRYVATDNRLQAGKALFPFGADLEQAVQVGAAANMDVRHKFDL